MFLTLERRLVRICNQWRLDGQKHCDLINNPAVSETVVLWGLHLVPKTWHKPRQVQLWLCDQFYSTSRSLDHTWRTVFFILFYFCVYEDLFVCLFFVYVTGPDPICFVSKLRTLRFLSCRIKTLIWILCIRVELGPKWQTRCVFCDQLILITLKPLWKEGLHRLLINFSVIFPWRCVNRGKKKQYILADNSIISSLCTPAMDLIP